MTLRYGLLLCALTTVVLLPSEGRSATIFVNPGESIQAALDGASPGDEVIVLPGTYFETLQLVDDVDLRAQTAGTAIVDGEADGSVVQAHQIGSSTLIQGMTFRNGSAEQGGGLFAVGSTALFLTCRFEDNGAAVGGGASLTQGSAITFDDCVFERNTASVGGGLHLDFSKPRIENSFINNNEARNDGAALAIQNASEATLEDNCIYANRSDEGAIISIVYSSPTIRNCTITTNDDVSGLGTLALHGSVARIERCIVAFNSGPAIQCSDSDFAWVGCNDFYGNGDDSICGADQGDNISVDPLFCNAQQSAFNVQANSPVLGTPCGDLGAHITTCPAITAVEQTSWSHVKFGYRY